MRTIGEQGHDLGLGKKVAPEVGEADPWVKVRDGVFRNTKTGKIETRIPENEKANQQPVIDPLEFFRRHGLIFGECED